MWIKHEIKTWLEGKPDMKGLEGRVACVTGAAQGIGREICTRLAEDGVNVAAFDINDPSQTVKRCLQSGSDAIGSSFDVRNKHQVHQVVDKVKAKWGAIDIWVNNAGVFDNTPTLELSEEKWDWVSDINYKSMFLCAQAVMPLMQKNRWGRIINLSSMAGKMAYSEEIAYCSSKAAVLGLTRALAAEFGVYGITVNAICPGPIHTEMLISAYQHLADLNGVTLEEWTNGIVETIPVARLGNPQDVAALVAFLASDEAGFITGQSINVDGGLVFY